MTIVVFATAIAGLAWVSYRARSRGVGGSVLGAFDEIWHPAGHRHRVEIQLQDQRKTPIPSPGDPPSLGPRSTVS